MDKCIHCGNTMTKQDMEEWHKESNKCCNGVDCGCRGMPTDPPECLPCIVKGLLEIAEKYKAKLTESEADNENLKRHGLRLQDCIDNRDKEIAQLRESLEYVKGLLKSGETIYAMRIIDNALTAGKGK